MGVVAIFSSLLILLALPYLDTSRIRGAEFRPLIQFLFWCLVADFYMLGVLGSQHVEDPFTTLGTICTIFYFAWFLVLVPIAGILENTFIDHATQKIN